MKTFKQFLDESRAIDRHTKKLMDIVRNNPDILKKIDAAKRMGEIEGRTGVSSMVRDA